MNQYEYLKNEYPEQINIRQMSTICKISLRSAKYLLDHEIVKAKISNKKSWKYQIPLENVIHYLVEKETRGSMIPKGSVTSRTDSFRQASRFKTFDIHNEREKIKQYFAYIFSEFNEILTRREVADMLGLHRDTILGYIKNEKIYEKKYNKISKTSVIDFACSEQYLSNKSQSIEYFKIIKGFEIWEQQYIGKTDEK